MGETVGLSNRKSEFISVRQLVFAIAEAEKRSPAEIATCLWNLLSESASAPEWLQHQDGITYRLEPRAQDTGWFALRALREGRDCNGGWDHRMGFSRPQLRLFFESCELSMSFEVDNAAIRNLSPGPQRDAAMLETHTRYEKDGKGKHLERTAAHFGCSKTVVTRAIKRARAAQPLAVGQRADWDPFGRR
ncbi:hypothetical protein G3N58_16170 [Paraburkholderia sp. Ac-20342]|uniref:hypothetical protein n=1 Tax=Paraburkholderia sp. Ac-20342 TaxID=2703889 RepID=UPI00197CD9AC|nr:hypothetical protein [Paraburkholderia sp. Ac-20342]MBN3848354.1 hypothetical protein [Paraburkholderia sp. Ac-20342]